MRARLLVPILQTGQVSEGTFDASVARGVFLVTIDLEGLGQESGGGTPTGFQGNFQFRLTTKGIRFAELVVFGLKESQSFFVLRASLIVVG